MQRRRGLGAHLRLRATAPLEGDGQQHAKGNEGESDADGNTEVSEALLQLLGSALEALAALLQLCTGAVQRVFYRAFALRQHSSQRRHPPPSNRRLSDYFPTRQRFRNCFRQENELDEEFRINYIF